MENKALPNIYRMVVELEPIVKLTCLEGRCKHNLIRTPGGYAACELKLLTLGNRGICDRLEFQGSNAEEGT